MHQVNIHEAKTHLSKLILQQPLEQIINEQIQINGIQVLNIKSAHVLGVASLPWHHSGESWLPASEPTEYS